MMQSDKVIPDNDHKTSNNVVNETKQYFILEDKFLLLKQCQQTILEKTEVSPSIRKMVNELISEENLQKVSTKFITVWNK